MELSKSTLAAAETAALRVKSEDDLIEIDESGLFIGAAGRSHAGFIRIFAITVSLDPDHPDTKTQFDIFSAA